VDSWGGVAAIEFDAWGRKPSAKTGMYGNSANGR